MGAQVRTKSAKELADMVQAGVSDPVKRPLLEEASRVVLTVLESFEKAVSSEHERLRGELDSLAAMIAKTKQEVEEIRAEEIEARHMPQVNGELGAIAAHLEEATGEILDACETIEGSLEGAPDEMRETIEMSVTRIYEACNFHDITGQRIRKVLGGLESIEERVAALLNVLGKRIPARKAPPPPEEAPPPPLMEGPQLPGQGRSQDEIDALFG